jgi:hypothetical protein
MRGTFQAARASANAERIGLSRKTLRADRCHTEPGAAVATGCKYAMPVGAHAAENLARAMAGEAKQLAA